MKEAYCTFEIAELLKKKGFDTFLPFGFNSTWHTPEPRKFIEDDGRGGFYDDKENWISCPTHQMAMAWLREKHHIFVEFSVSIDLNGDYHYRYSILNRECKYERKGYPSFGLNYEDAVEAALKYVLENLI